MRRLLSVLTLVTAFVLIGAAPAFAAHCYNQSKADGAGSGWILFDMSGDVVAMSDGLVNQQGRLTVGYIQFRIDLNDNGMFDGPDVATPEFFIAANHKHTLDELSQMDPEDLFVIPGAEANPSDQGVTLFHP